MASQFCRTAGLEGHLMLDTAPGDPQIRVRDSWSCSFGFHSQVSRDTITMNTRWLIKQFFRNVSIITGDGNQTRPWEVGFRQRDFTGNARDTPEYSFSFCSKLLPVSVPPWIRDPCESFEQLQFWCVPPPPP